MIIAEFASWLGNLGKTALLGEGVEGGFPDVQQNGLCDLQLGTRVFNDVPVKMRTELWLSQLHRDKGKGAIWSEQYRLLLSQPLNPDLIAEIDKDTHRTFPGHPKLSTKAGQRSLLNVLRAYAASDPDIGYAQGMNFLAGLLLSYLDEADAFGALMLVMRDRGLREMYAPDMALLQVRLWQLGRLMPQDVAQHMEEHAVLPVLYASSWFLTLFAGDFPMSIAARLMDLVISDSYAAPLMKMAVHIIERCRPEILKLTDMEDIVHLLRQTVPNWSLSTLHDLLTEALAKPWTPRQAAILTQINGAESVADAVARVDQAAKTREDGVASPTAGTTPVGTGHVAPQPKVKRRLPRLPGTIKVEKVERWRPATPAMALVSRDSARIKPMIGEVALDPALSKQLWQYSHEYGNDQQQQQQQDEGKDLKTEASNASTAAPATPVTVSLAPPGVASTSTTTITLGPAGGDGPSTPASPFDTETTPSAAAGGGGAIPSRSLHRDGDHSRMLSRDFGSFQAAGSAVDPAQRLVRDLIDLHIGEAVQEEEQEFGAWNMAPAATSLNQMSQAMLLQKNSNTEGKSSQGAASSSKQP